MIDFILSRFDTLLYMIIFAGIYCFILYLWRKIASLETSVYRLDKALTNMILEKEKQNFQNENNSLYTVFNDQNNNVKIDEVQIDEVQINDVQIDEVQINDVQTDVDTVNEIVKELLDEDSKKFTKSQLLKMTVEGLKEIATLKKISIEGNKNDLIQKIIDNS